MAPWDKWMLISPALRPTPLLPPLQSSSEGLAFPDPLLRFYPHNPARPRRRPRLPRTLASILGTIGLLGIWPRPTRECHGRRSHRVGGGPDEVHDAYFEARLSEAPARSESLDPLLLMMFILANPAEPEPNRRRCTRENCNQIARKTPSASALSSALRRGGEPVFGAWPSPTMQSGITRTTGLEAAMGHRCLHYGAGPSPVSGRIARRRRHLQQRAQPGGPERQPVCRPGKDQRSVLLTLVRGADRELGLADRSALNDVAASRRPSRSRGRTGSTSRSR